MPKINDIGMAEIRAFWHDNAIAGYAELNAGQIAAFCRDALQNLADGKAATIVLRAHVAACGRTLEYTISDAGIDRAPPNIKPGDTVAYESYGVTTRAVVQSVSRDGKLVFTGKGRFIHAVSVLSITRTIPS